VTKNDEKWPPGGGGLFNPFFGPPQLPNTPRAAKSTSSLVENSV